MFIPANPTRTARERAICTVTTASSIEISYGNTSNIPPLSDLQVIFVIDSRILVQVV